MKKKLVVLLLIFSTVMVYSQDSKFYFKSSMGYSFNSKKFSGVATDVGVGYKPLKYFGLELTVNNTYQYLTGDYTYREVSATNTGLSLVFHAYPLQLKKHVVDLNIGFGLNMNYWINKYGGMGRYMYKIPVSGAGYYYRFAKFDLGLCYSYQYYKFYRDMKNHQYSISFKKSF